MPLRQADLNETLSILCVHQGFELYGSDRVFLQSIRALREHYPSSRLTALVPKPGPLAEELSAVTDQVDYSRLLVLRRQSLRNLKLSHVFTAVRAIFEARRTLPEHDLVLISTVTVLDFLLATRFSRTPALLHVHECVTGFERLFFSLLLNASRCSILFNSMATQRSYWLAPWRHRAVVHNGGSEPAAGQEGPGYDARNDERLHVLMLGRLSPRKGQLLLLDALRRLQPSQRKRILVRIVGDSFGGSPDPLRAIVRKRAELGLEDCVAIEPFSRETAELYEWSDLTVLPSLRPESFGMVAIEAMARSRPVVAAAHGGLLEVVTDRVTGRLFQPGDPTALADILANYLAKPSDLVEHGRAGLARYRESFTEQAFADGFLVEVRNALDLKPRWRTSRHGLPRKQ